MTRCYFRTKNLKGEYVNVEIEHLSPAERRSKFVDMDFDRIMSFVDVLCNTIVACEKVAEEMNELIEHRNP